jgi:polar amino acid transport system substrate-binding protein
MDRSLKQKVVKLFLNRIASSLVISVLLVSCASMPLDMSTVRSDLAPDGVLHAAINFGNPILATKNPSTGEPQGVSVDLARELAKRLGVPIELVTYEAAGKVVADADSGNWDIGFVALDPRRAEVVSFTAAYVVIEGAYLVEKSSSISRNEEVDSEGVRVVVGAGSAYDLFLTRNLTQATIVRSPTSPTVVDMFIEQHYEVAAGVKQQLEADAKRLPGLRLLDGRFMEIKQAMVARPGRDAGAIYLREFVEEMKSSGFVARALERHDIDGAAVAPLE